MSGAVNNLRCQWARSRAYRVVLVVAVAYVLLRLAVHGAYLAMMLYPESGVMGGMPEWAGAEAEPMVPVDLQVYLDAAENLVQREDLYLVGPITRLEDLYQYTPAFALAFVSFLRMSPALVSLVHTLIHVAAYAFLYLAWDRIFREASMEQARQVLARTLPVWLVFSPFWSDLGYLNIYILCALLGTLLIRSVLRQELFWCVVWLSLILQSKPQWAFAAVVPLLLGRWRFFLRMVGWSILAYAGIMGATMVFAGPTYVGQQYAQYVRSLSTLPARFPWRGPDAPFLGYNHSVKQIIVYLLGESDRTLRFATLIKLLLLVPMVVVTGRPILSALRGRRLAEAQRALGLALLLYLGAFIWLDMLWELSLGVVVFAYLLATPDQPWVKYLLWAIFVPYALVDLWQLVSFAVFGMDVIAPGPYVLTDPSIHIPMVMIVVLAFYALTIRRLWHEPPTGTVALEEARP